MRKKNRLRVKVVEYLADPENPFLSWSMVGQAILGHKNPKSIYRLFDSEERDQIFSEALKLRRKRYTYLLAEVDRGLFRRAINDGDPTACKLLYQRFEGWAATEKHEQVVTIEEKLRQIREKREREEANED